MESALENSVAADLFSRREFLAVTAVLAGLPLGLGKRGLFAGNSACRPPLFGAALQPSLLGDPAYATLFAQWCAIATLGGPLYWSTFEPQQGQFNLQPVLDLLAFTEQHKIASRGHTLVWHESVPKWVPNTLTEAEASTLLTNHVKSAVAPFRGRLHSWDVVNEPIDPLAVNGAYRETRWFKAMGPGYIDLAFRQARAADPNALLGLNEYALEPDGVSYDRKRAATLTVLTKLRNTGVPIDYLGVEAHLVAGDRYSKASLGRFLSDVSDLGLRVVITELDVDDRRAASDPAVRDQAVADVYGRFLDIVMSSVTPEAVITWGLTDRSTWNNWHAPRADGLPQRSLPFDAELSPKAAWRVLQRRIGVVCART